MAAAKRLGHSNANVATWHYARVVDDRDAEIPASFARHGPASGHAEHAEHDDVVNASASGPDQRAAGPDAIQRSAGEDGREAPAPAGRASAKPAP